LRLQIEKLVYGGDGLARLPAERVSEQTPARGKAVFIPFTLAAEQVEASITEEKPGFARAHADQIVAASPHRTDPQCPYFFRCGGCQYQHATYEHQLDIKREILRENVRRIAKLELSCEIQTHPSPPWNYRNRCRLQVRTSCGFQAGYFKFASRDLLPVEHCPISSPLINRAIAALWQAGRACLPEGLNEIEFFADGEDEKLLVEMRCSGEAKASSLRNWAEELMKAMPQIAGCAIFHTNSRGVGEPLGAIGAQTQTYRTTRSDFRVSSGSFFQVNRFLVDELVDIVAAGNSGEVALDLYAGVGLFSAALACDFRHVISVESSQIAAHDLSYNLPSNGRPICSATDEYLLPLVSGFARADAGHWPAQSPSSKSKGPGRTGKFPRRSFHKPDLIVVDPPRGGLGQRVAHALASVHAPRVTYVSCDPATLARDLVPMLAAGYRIEELHFVDLFPQTYHLESVVKLLKG